MKQIKADSIADLKNVAEEIISSLGERRIVAFWGAMGAGKTTLIRSICQELGTTDTVSSPTFAIVNEYDSADGKPVYHFDFYRINKIEEAFDFGYEEYFFSGHLCLVEWPEKIETLLPDNVMRVNIDVIGEDNTRIFSFE